MNITLGKYVVLTFWYLENLRSRRDFKNQVKFQTLKGVVVWYEKVNSRVPVIADIVVMDTSAVAGTEGDAA